MPRTSVTPMARDRPLRSPRRIAQTPSWQVNELITRTIVRTSANHGSAWRLNCSASSGVITGIEVGEAAGGQTGEVFRTLK